MTALIGCFLIFVGIRDFDQSLGLLEGPNFTSTLLVCFGGFLILE